MGTPSGKHLKNVQILAIGSSLLDIKKAERKAQAWPLGSSVSPSLLAWPPSQPATDPAAPVEAGPVPTAQSPGCLSAGEPESGAGSWQRAPVSRFHLGHGSKTHG